MRILTLGDSWTFGSESTDPEIYSWPSQMSRKYQIEVTNLSRGGCSNQRQCRIGIEELCRDNSYDWVIFALGPACRTEVLDKGKWRQVWPNLPPWAPATSLDKMYTDLWHSWNDVQLTLLLATGLSFKPSQYVKEIDWILNYRGDNDFRSLGMPVQEWNIGIKDLHRKLMCLKSILLTVQQHQPDCFADVDDLCLQPHGPDVYASGGHPNDRGYGLLADYFAHKIGLTA
jgi:hypothetical protein